MSTSPSKYAYNLCTKALVGLRSVDQRLYRSLVKDLAVRLDGNTETRVSGMVINTMGWVEDLGYDVRIVSEVLHH